MEPFNPITVHFQHTLSDHIHAWRAYDTTTFSGKLNKAVGVLLFGFACWLVYSSGIRWWTIVWFLVAFLEWFDWLSVRPLQIWLFFQWNPRVRDSYDVTFDEQGVHLKSAKADSRLAWTYYTGVLETNHVFLFILGKHLFTVIPKRSFVRDDDIHTLRELIQRNLGDIKTVSAVR